MNNELIANLKQLIITNAVTYGQKILLAIVIYFVGSWVIDRIAKSFKTLFEKREVDVSLRPFLNSLINITLKVTLFISIAGIIGVEMTSFIALLGTIGVGVGLALSGTLQNVAGGVVLLILRPFNVGDFIEAQGVSGTVESIRIFNTILKTPDNKVVILPNAGIANGNIINYTREDKRRVDLTFGIAYSDSIEKAIAIVLEEQQKEARILKDEPNAVNVAALADSSVNLYCRSWVKKEDYWAVYSDMLRNVKNRFDAEGISIPFPQRDVHMYNVKP